ncbi:MAG: recombinase family protein, partial [Verrucomicrobiales bacterium]|nr:recombinase family protein [Verrucomicrobiales bacterium]
NDVRRGRLQMVICFKLDRLGRSLAHLAQIVAELSTHRVALVCTSQGIDTSDTNPAGRLQLGVLMAVAEFERELIRERVLAGIAAAKASGKRLGRKEKLSKRAPDVKALVQQGKGTREISRLLKMPVGSVCKVKAFLSRSRPDSDDKGKAQPTSHLQTTGLTVD